MRTHFTLLVLLAATLIGAVAGAQQSATPGAVIVDANAPGRSFPHFWEQAFGSGRAILALRERYRDDLREVTKVTGVRYVRFHAILHDEVGVYSEDKNGNSIYNFTYVDQIYDGLLKLGVRPIVEISFMPRQLAAKEAIHPFWYKQNVAPPKDYAKWDALIRQFAQHLIDRYGIAEVSQWYFEVWNEPNIDFWAGEPKQETYFELYDHTARALKSADQRLRVGGPATAQAAWVDAFLAHCAKENVPVDFVSSHAYADDTVQNLFGTKEEVPVEQRVCRAIAKVRGQIEASRFPSLPLFWTEWNVPSFGPLDARNTIYAGAALADHIRQCDGVAEITSYWTFDDVFEEGGVPKDPFHGRFGLISAGGIKKPSFYAFALLHQLGDTRLDQDAPGVLATRRPDRTLVLAAWNLVDPRQRGSSKTVRFQFTNLNPSSSVLIARLDEKHSNSLAEYRAMGSPSYPTQSQIEQLNRSSTAQFHDAQSVSLKDGSMELEIPPNGLVLLTVIR